MCIYIYYLSVVAETDSEIGALAALIVELNIYIYISL